MKPATRARAEAAAQWAWPGTPIVEAASIEAALRLARTAETELLLLDEPAPASLAPAAAALDPAGLPRWALVIFGREPIREARAAAVAPDFSPAAVAEVFLAAARLNARERENARLRGDLSTIGRRISHDLRSPLAAIYTACEGLNEILADSADDHSAYTQSIATSADELAQLIERVSIVIRASAEPSPAEPVSMKEAVFNTLQRLERSVLRKGVVVTQPAAWPTVMGVGTWLEIVWFNLIANALHRASATTKIELGWQEANGQLLFWVDDNGPGVPREKIEKLFQPFHRLHRLDAPRGLGLALVQRLVELQGGSCGHRPRPEGGAHFFFTLPGPKVP